jgi:hypothetical protein
MSDIDDWSGEERRKGRRREEPAYQEHDGGAEGSERRKSDRRRAQICFICRDEFVATGVAQTICPSCQMEGVRGGGRSSWRAPRF